MSAGYTATVLIPVVTGDFSYALTLSGGTILTTGQTSPTGNNGLAIITGGEVITIGSASSGVSAAFATNPADSASLTYPVVVIDTTANVLSNIDGLETLALAGKLGSITLESYLSSGLEVESIPLVEIPPTVAVTSSQLSSDRQAINAISSDYQLSIAAAPVSTTIIGEAGHANTIDFSGSAANYTVTPAGDGRSFTISDGAITDHLNGITALRFSDYIDMVASTLPVVPGAVSSAQVTELYSAVLGRAPDALGLAYYEASIATTPATSLVQYAESFLNSPEYTANSAHHYAQTAAGEAQFITDAYANLLNRAPEAGAIPYYQNVISQFIKGLTPGTAAYATADLDAHATVLASFSQSAEFLGDVSITAAHPADARHWLVLI